jgi:hypothetical protein
MALCSTFSNIASNRMSSQAASDYASASPKNSPYKMPAKLTPYKPPVQLKPAPPKMLSILELSLQEVNFKLLLLLDHVGEVREFTGGRGGCVLRLQLSDHNGLLCSFVLLPHLSSLMQLR